MSNPVKFETVEQVLNFRCEWGVYREGQDSSLCYVTSKERGDFICAALEEFVQSGGAKKWIRNLKRREKRAREKLQVYTIKDDNRTKI